MSRWLAALVLAWALAVLPSLAWPADTVPLAQGGVPRSYLVHLPPQQAGGAALPLLIALHGTSMRAGDMFEYTDLPQVADRAGFVLASPAALGAAFNDGMAPPGSEAAAVDDVGFIEAVARDAQRRFGVRADAVYVVGFSSGGSMVQRLAIESRYPFAGFAAVASAPRVPAASIARPAPLLLVFGDADPLNPVDGGWVWIPVLHKKAAQAATVRQWAQWLHCQGDAERPAQVDGVTTRLWPHCADGARLAWVSIEGLGHQWAGARPMPFPSFVLGPQRATPSLGELVWRFLAP